MVRRAVGSNQYRLRLGTVLPQAQGDDLLQQAASAGKLQRPGDAPDRMRCGEVWGTDCRAWVQGPSWGHGQHMGFTDPYTKRPIGTAFYDEIPTAVLVDLANSEEEMVRAAVAADPGCPDDVRLRLMQDPSYGVRASAVAGITDPGWMMQHLQRGTQEDLEGLAHNPRASSEILGEIASRKCPSRVLRQVVLHANCPLEVLERAVQRKNGTFIDAAVNNPNIPVQMLEMAARNPACRSSTAFQIMQSAPESAAAIISLSSHSNDWVRARALHSPIITQDMLVRAAEDPSPTVRLEVAESGSTPAEVVERLVVDPDHRVRAATIRHPSRTPQRMQHLAQDPSPSVRQTVSWSKACPPDVLVRLAGDTEENVRLGAARNPNSPTAAIAQLVGDSDPEIHRAALEHPNCPEEYKSLAQVAG